MPSWGEVFLSQHITAAKAYEANTDEDDRNHREEIERVCYLIQGRIAPFFEPLEMGMAEKTVVRSIAQASHSTVEHIAAQYARLGDLGLVAEQAQREAEKPSRVLDVNDVFLGLKSIAQTTGRGAIEQKMSRLSQLLTQADSLSAKYIVHVLLGNLRLGIGDATVLDALASAAWNDVKKRKLLEGAYNITSDLGLLARTLWEHPGEEEAQRAVAGLTVQVSRPIRLQLAERLPSAEAIIERMGAVVAQYKVDGFCTQIHKDGQHVSIFSRNLEDLSDMFPELIAGTLKQVRAERSILDAEALAYNTTSEEFLPFQETTRRRRKHQVSRIGSSP